MLLCNSWHVGTLGPKSHETQHSGRLVLGLVVFRAQVKYLMRFSGKLDSVLGTHCVDTEREELEFVITSAHLTTDSVSLAMLLTKWQENIISATSTRELLIEAYTPFASSSSSAAPNGTRTDRPAFQLQKNSLLQSPNNMLKRVAIGFAATSALLVLTLSAMQDAIIYHPRTYSSFGAFQYYENIKLKFKQQTGQTIEPFEYEDAMNGGTQTSYFIAARQQTMTDLWVVFGGNAQLALDWVEFITTVRIKHPSLDSHAFVLFDYPGYGQSMGKVNETSLRWSIKAAIQRVVKQPDAIKINLLAHSIGCAVALNFAVHEPINGGLVLISPFASIPQMALDILVPFGSKNSFALTIANYLVHAENQWDNVQRIRDLAGNSNNKRQTLPLVIIHGDRDNIVPVEHGRMLHTETKRFPLFRTMQYIEIKRGDHNSIVYVSADTIIEDGMKQVCSRM